MLFNLHSLKKKGGETSVPLLTFPKEQLNIYSANIVMSELENLYFQSYKSTAVTG